MVNVPPEWLLWWDEFGNNPCPQLKEYVTDCKVVLLQEVDLNKLKK